MGFLEIRRIITHNDFDGLVSASLSSFVTGCNKFIFTGPNSVERAEISIDDRDVVCDLPYPLECGLWFDHHAGNRDALELRGINPDSLPGRFAEKPSCARVIYEYYSEQGIKFPTYLLETVSEADIIDSFSYSSIEEWRSETPGKLVDMSIKVSFPTPRERTKYYSLLVDHLRDLPLAEILKEKQVSSNIEKYRDEELRMIELIKKSCYFLKRDMEKEIAIIDLTDQRKRSRVIRNLAYLVHPRILAVISLVPIFRGVRKTNNFSVSMSLSMNMTGRDHGKNIGGIMRELNIGDGHPGAAAGIVSCISKKERLGKRERIINEIWDLWKKMPLEK